MSELFGLDNIGENLSELKLKSDDEIEAYAVDEHISEVDRAKLYLDSGTPIQRLCLVSLLPGLYKQYPSEIDNDILKKLMANLLHEDVEIQIGLSQTLEQMLTDGLLGSAFVTNRLLKPVLEIMKQRDESLVTMWSPAFFAAFSVMPKSVLSNEVLKLANTKGELTEPVQSRILCCRLYGKLAAALDARSIEAGFLKKAMELCQDTDFEVRIEMCKQLPAIGRGMGADATAKQIFAELQELLNDEELDVRLAAFEALIDLLETFDPTTRKQEIIPLIKRYIRTTPDDMIKMVASLFGPLVYRIWPDLDEEDDQPLFCEFYKNLAERPEAESRRLCAFNFPAVLKSMGARKYALHLHATFAALADDTFVGVRRTIAAGFHEVASILGKERGVKYLKEIFIRLLRDDSGEVQEALIPHLDTTLSQFAVTNAEVKSATYSDLIPPLLALCSATSSWRKQNTLLEQFINLPTHFGGDQLYEHFVPLLFKYMQLSAAPVKHLATKMLCSLMRKLKYRYQREEVAQRLINEFARGSSYWLRMLFVDMCTHILDTFSRIFFKSNFFFIALELAKDKVPNVRLKLCEILPSLKRVIKLPKDNVALERLSSLTAELTTDDDRDVAAAAKVAQSKLSSIDARIEGVSRDDSAEDVEDRRREEEERQMQVLEDAEGGKKGPAGRGIIRPTGAAVRPDPTPVARPQPVTGRPEVPRPAPIKPPVTSPHTTPHTTPTAGKPDMTLPTKTTAPTVPPRVTQPAPTYSPPAATVKPPATGTASGTKPGVIGAVGTGPRRSSKPSITTAAPTKPVATVTPTATATKPAAATTASSTISSTVRRSTVSAAPSTTVTATKPTTTTTKPLTVKR
eukprot:TRINITY_DN6605_c0_g1_i1.p1 TRINITY_DN6605_c0_g1~~TRINITY_DN6605_c0_g1_i1.p1  ORF type:complete len:855 (+),score=161.77 TRINITY_DN6605_c0_g1_i1:112-2676(+)